MRSGVYSHQVIQQDRLGREKNSLHKHSVDHFAREEERLYMKKWVLVLIQKKEQICLYLNLLDPLTSSSLIEDRSNPSDSRPLQLSSRVTWNNPQMRL